MEMSVRLIVAGVWRYPLKATGCCRSRACLQFSKKDLRDRFAAYELPTA